MDTFTVAWGVALHKEMLQPHGAGAALEIWVLPCITPVKWSVASVQVVSPFMSSQSSWRLESEECMLENEKSIDSPW